MSGAADLNISLIFIYHEEARITSGRLYRKFGTSNYDVWPIWAAFVCENKSLKGNLWEYRLLWLSVSVLVMYRLCCDLWAKRRRNAHRYNIKRGKRLRDRWFLINDQNGLDQSALSGCWRWRSRSGSVHGVHFYVANYILMP